MGRRQLELFEYACSIYFTLLHSTRVYHTLDIKNLKQKFGLPTPHAELPAGYSKYWEYPFMRLSMYENEGPTKYRNGQE